MAGCVTRAYCRSAGWCGYFWRGSTLRCVTWCPTAADRTPARHPARRPSGSRERALRVVARAPVVVRRDPELPRPVRQRLGAARSGSGDGDLDPRQRRTGADARGARLRRDGRVRPARLPRRAGGPAGRGAPPRGHPVRGSGPGITVGADRGTRRRHFVACPGTGTRYGSLHPRPVCGSDPWRRRPAACRVDLRLVKPDC